MRHHVRITQTTRIEYPWRQMQPGDDFVVPVASRQSHDYDTVQRRTVNAIRMQRNGGRYITRRTVIGILVRRVE